MDEQDHGYALTGDALSQAAIAAANRSHMPYSKSPSGVALECKTVVFSAAATLKTPHLTRLYHRCRGR